MLVALCGSRFIWNGYYSWWNDYHRFRVMCNGVVDDLAIIRPVCRHRRSVSLDLIE
jgi:hypothetical protein